MYLNFVSYLNLHVVSKRPDPVQGLNFSDHELNLTAFDRFTGEWKISALLIRPQLSQDMSVLDSGILLSLISMRITGTPQLT